MKEAGIKPDSAYYNSMIGPLCEAEKLEEARIILATMIAENVSPTIETYHTFLEVASVDGTLEFLSHMKKAGLGPKRDTFLLIYGKFLKLRQPENALNLESAHYTVLVEGLATCGLLVKVREYYAEMRLSGISDDPKLKKLLKEPVRHCSHQREKAEPLRVMRNTTTGAWVCRGRSSVMRRKRGGKWRRKATTVT